MTKQIIEYKAYKYVFMFYAFILSIIFFKLPLFFDILVIFTIYILNIKFDNSAIVYYPLLSYPFMFILKSPGDGNSPLGFFPDFFTLTSILYVFFIYKNIKLKKITYYIIFHSIITYLIVYFHISDVSFILILLRQFVLPLMYLVVLIIYTENSNNFIEKGFYITKFSFTIVAIVAIFNLLGIINFNSSLPELQPVLTSITEDSTKVLERSSVFLTVIPRLNLLTGGALGSSAAIFMCLAIVIILETKTILYKIVCSLPLLISSLLTASFSVTTPIFILFIVFFFFKFKLLKKIFFGLLGIFIGLVLYFKFDFNPIYYFNDSILTVVFEFFQQLDFSSLIFGVGPRVTSDGFNYLTEKKMFMIDVGMFRVFVETGILNFIFFIFLIFYSFKKGVLKLRKKYNVHTAKYFIIFSTMCLLVHANFATLPPFYPLFSLCYCALLDNNKQITNNTLKLKQYV